MYETLKELTTEDLLLMYFSHGAFSFENVLEMYVSDKRFYIETIKDLLETMFNKKEGSNKNLSGGNLSNSFSQLLGNSDFSSALNQVKKLIK